MTSPVAILGPGLLGGSLALALQARGKQVAVWARRAEAAAEVRAGGFAQFASTEVRAVVEQAETVILAVPIGAMPALAREIAQHLRREVLVTDVGSVKAGVCTQLGAILGESFVGSHPMAGSEQAGLSAARADLFDGAVCIVTPEAKTPPSQVQRAADFWGGLGALVRTMPPAEHDALVAAISHLPHLLAAALVQSVAETRPAAFDLCGPGFRDTTRVAGGPPAMWTEILGENRSAVRAALDALIEKLRGISTLLGTDAPERDLLMNQLLTEARAARERLRLPKVLSDA
jgi:prephenate dehydrogenase